jgi:hypothetical protein
MPAGKAADIIGDHNFVYFSFAEVIAKRQSPQDSWGKTENRSSDKQSP